jgi:uncharacterized membrane protein
MYLLSVRQLEVDSADSVEVDQLLLALLILHQHLAIVPVKDFESLLIAVDEEDAVFLALLDQVLDGRFHRFLLM